MKKFLSVLLAVMMVLSTVSFAIPSAVGTFDAAVESEAAEMPVAVPEETATLAADDTWYDIQKGTLLFNMDFDSDNSGNAVSASAYDAISLGSYSAGAGELVSGLGRLNPDVAGNYDMGFRYTQSGSATVAEENGNKYFSVNSSVSNQFSLYLGNTFTKAGKYVLEYDYKVVSSAEPNYIQYNTPSNGNDTGFKFGEWASSTSAYELTGASNAARVIFYAKSNYASTDTLMLDNIKVWYYDESVDYEEILNPDIETNDTWEDAEKGQKLFTIDFTAKNDKKAVNSASWDTIVNRLDNNPTTGELISDLGRINPDVDGSDYRISINYIDNTKTELVTEGDNTYLALAPDSTKGDVSLYLGGFYGEEGTYTIETSYKFVQTGENAITRVRYETLGGIEYKDEASISAGEWVDLSEVHEHASCSHGNVNRTRFTTEGYGNTPYAANDRIYIDNIAVYYKAPETEEPVASEWDNTEKGYRVFLADFETKNDGTAVISTDVAAITNGRVDSTPATAGIAATSAARVNPEYSSIARLNVKGGAGANIQGTADNQHLSLTSVGDSLILSQLYVGDGTYVIEFDANSISVPSVRGSYSEGTVPTTESLDATWTRYTFVSENVTEASSKSCSSYHTDNIRFYFGTAPSKYDNIVVYYQPAGWTPPSTEGGDEGDEGDDEPAVNEWIDNNYGEKLFIIDLDGDTKYQTAALANLNNRIDGTNDNVASNGLYLADIGRTNPEYASYEGTFKYSFKDGGTPVVEGTDDKYFKHTSGSQASVMVANPFVGAGTYTVTFNHNANVTFKLHSGYGSTDGTVTTTVVDDTWATTVATVEISEQSSNDFFRIYANTAPGTYTIDDVALFYKPEGWTPPSEGGGDDEGNWTDEEKGNLLYTIDFTTKNDGTAVTASDIASITSGRIDNNPTTAGLVVSNAGRVNPKYSSKAFRVNVKDAGTSSIDGTDNKYLTQTVGTTMSFYVGSFYVGEGRYTVEFDTNSSSGQEFVLHSGFTSGTLTKTAVDSTWTRYTYVFDATSDLSFIRFISSGPSNEGKFTFDNIKIYYKQTMADVTVKANGNANVSDTVVKVDAENGAKVGNIIAAVDRSMSTKKLLGASLTADGQVLASDYVVKPSEVNTIYLIWGGDIEIDPTPWYDEDGYGTLLFDINWDGVLSSAEQSRWADVRAAGASINPEFYLKEKFYFMWGTEDIGGTTWIPANSPLIVAEADGNRYYTQPHAQTYNEFGFYAPSGGDYALWADAGVFTIKYDVKISGDISVATHFVDPNLAKDFAVTKTDIRLTTPVKANKDGWQTVVYQFDASEFVTQENESLGKLVIYTQTNESSAVANAFICYDNIQVYWKPSKVNVTLKPDTNNEVNETVVAVSTRGVLVSDLLKSVDMSDTTLNAKGIRNADSSVVLGLNDTLTVLEDATYYIIWEENAWTDNELGMLIMNGNFEGEWLTTGINRWPEISTLGTSQNPDYSYEGVTGLQYTVSGTGIAFDSEGKWIPADYKKTENLNTYFEFPIGNESYNGKGYTNFNAYAMGKGASQYQYQGAGIYTVSAKVRFPEELNVSTARMSLNAYNGTGIYNVASEDYTDLEAGKWHEISATWVADASVGHGLGSTEIYFFYEPTSEKINVAVDDYKIYFKPFTAEVTLRANNNPVAKDIVLSDVSTSGISTEELISNIKTPLGGMDLVGLAYDKAGTKMLEGDIVIGGDARFFMIWKDSEIDPSAPVSENVNAIRTDDPIGMRFRSYVTSTVYADATQVGWVATRLDMLEAKDINSYDFTIESDVTKIYAYNKDTDGTNKVFGTDDVNTYITAVLYNIPEKHYKTTLVARPFTVVDGVTYYGFPVERSIYEVAVAVRDGGYAGCSNDQITYINSILEA